MNDVKKGYRNLPLYMWPDGIERFTLPEDWEQIKDDVILWRLGVKPKLLEVLDQTAAYPRGLEVLS